MNKDVIKSFVTTIERYEKDNLPKLLEAHGISTAKFTQIVISEVKKSQKMQEAFLNNPASLFASILHCAELGLNPSEMVGDFFFIPFKGGIKPILGYKGLINLILRSGKVAKISCEVVYEGDDFEYELGLEPKLAHIPNHNASRKSTDIKWIYAVAKLSDGEIVFKVMSRDEIMAIANISNVTNNLYFNDKKDPQNWMAKKTVLKQLSKLLPKDYYGQKAVSVDDSLEGEGYLMMDDENNVKYVKGRILSQKQNIYGALNTRVLDAEENVENATFEELNERCTDTQ